MTERHVRALNEDEQALVIHAVEKSVELGFAEDIALLDKAATELRGADLPEDEQIIILEAIGGGLGQHLQTATGANWAAVTDGVSSAIVLIGNIADKQVVLYPFDVVSRRWEIEEEGVFTRYFDDVIEQIRAAKES